MQARFRLGGNSVAGACVRVRQQEPFDVRAEIRAEKRAQGKQSPHDIVHCSLHFIRAIHTCSIALYFADSILKSTSKLSAPSKIAAPSFPEACQGPKIMCLSGSERRAIMALEMTWRCRSRENP
jgi:hypothetical protein